MNKLLTLLLFLLCSGQVFGKDYLHSCEYADSQTPTSSLACNLYFEARSKSEGVVGLYAVAFNTLNRVKSSRFPDTITGVVYQTSQYSWQNDGKSDRVYDGVSWRRCLEVAKAVLLIPDEDYQFYDITKGALFYHSVKIIPYWVDKSHTTVTINNHVFYSSDLKR